MTRLLVLAFTLLATFSFAQSPTSFTIYFDYDKHDIRDSEHKTLAIVLDSVQKHPNCTLKLWGNTDADGSNTYNQTLSENRISAVKSFLMEKGVMATQFQTFALGELKPVAENETETGKQRNRRVDIFMEFVPKSTPSVAEKKFPFEKGKKYGIQRLYKEVALPVQEFDYISGTEAVLLGEKGTILHIPANAFNVPDKSVLKINVKEAYSYGDMFRENLTTTSGSNKLQTGGMVNIGAFYNGQPIKPTENIMLMMPTQSGKRVSSDDPSNDMQFFTGTRTPKNNVMDWTLPQRPNFGFFFEAYNVVGQRNALNAVLKTVTDTFNCKQMFVWRVDSFYYRKALKNGNTTAFKEPFIVSDEKPAGYVFDHVQTEGLSPECLKIAAWAAPEQSWHRKVPWKMKHQILNTVTYQAYRATDYDSLLTAIKRYIRLNEEAEVNMKAAKTINANGYFVFETRQLNWINCDRFYNYAAEDLVNIETDMGNAPFIDAKIILQDMSSVLNANGNKGVIAFNRIPKGKQAIVVAMKIENGVSFYAIQSLKTENARLKLKFEMMTPDEIVARMKYL